MPVKDTRKEKNRTTNLFRGWLSTDQLRQTFKIERTRENAERRGEYIERWWTSLFLAILNVVALCLVNVIAFCVIQRRGTYLSLAVVNWPFMCAACNSNQYSHDICVLLLCPSDRPAEDIIVHARQHIVLQEMKNWLMSFAYIDTQ